MGRPARILIPTARIEKLERRLALADDLLRRLSEWDMLYVRADGVAATADAPYWQSEIAKTRAEMRGERNP